MSESGNLTDLRRRMTVAKVRYDMRRVESRATNADVWAAWLEYRRAALIYGDLYGWGAADDPVGDDA